jgi:hypothetical protein
MTILFDDSKPVFRDAILQIIPTGKTADDCVCCGAEPDCDERKVCDGEFPVKINSFYLDVSGIPDTMTANLYDYFLVESDGSPGCICDIFLEVELFYEYELTGFAALNRRYEVTDISYPFGGGSCDNVCRPCQWTIRNVNVPISGTFTLTGTYKDTNSCFPETDRDDEIDEEQELCASASIELTYDTVTETFKAFISINGRRLLSVVNGNPETGTNTPTPPGELSYINLKEICNYPDPKTTNYSGDFLFLAAARSAHSTPPCLESETTGDPILTSFSFQCPDNAIDEEIASVDEWQDCEYSHSTFEENEFGDPDLADGCTVTTTIEVEFERVGLTGFSARLVRT